MKKLYILVGLFVAIGITSGVSAVAPISAARFQTIVADKQAAVRVLLLAVKNDKSALNHAKSLKKIEDIIKEQVDPLIKELITEMGSSKSTNDSRSALLVKQRPLWQLVIDALTTEFVASRYDDPFWDGLRLFIFPVFSEAG